MTDLEFQALYQETAPAVRARCRAVCGNHADADEALQEYQVAMALNPHDKATAWYRLASAQHALGNVEESQANVLQALDIAPNFRPAQRLLLKLAGGETQN